MTVEDSALEVLARFECENLGIDPDIPSEAPGLKKWHVAAETEKLRLAALKEAGIELSQGWSDDMDAAPRDESWVEFCNAKHRYRGRLKYYPLHPVNDDRATEWRTEAGNLTTIANYTHWRLEAPLPAPPEATK